MADRQEFTAIEIVDLEAWKIICAIDPHWNEISFEEAQGSFLVTDFPREGKVALVPPRSIRDNFDHITPSNLKIKLVQIVK